MSKKIYFDNAATSFPKPKCVAEAMVDYMTNNGASLHRGDYGSVFEVENAALTLREQLCQLFCHDEIKNVVINAGATMGMNTVLIGSLNEGDHVLVSSMEHNAVMRPLHELECRGVSFDHIPCDSQGRLDPNKIPQLIKPNTKMLVLCHASNVCGTLQNAAAVGQVCKEHNLLYVLDGAQTAGHVNIDFAKWNLDALVLPAHKGLMGPSGIGALLLSRRLADAIRPLITGGTGSRSDDEHQPWLMPDKLESGTLNMPGIYGFSAALGYIHSVGVDALFERERLLTARFLSGVASLRNVKLYGIPNLIDRVGVIALDFIGTDNALAASRLEQKGIMTRCGLHCAPLAHKTLGSFPRGLVRFSIGAFTTEADIDAALGAIEQI